MPTMVRRGVLALVVAVALAPLLLLAHHAEAATSGTSRLNGNWYCCGAGGASPQIWVINGSSGVLETTSGTPFGTLSDTLKGNQVTVVQTYGSFDPGYVATAVGTLSDNDTKMTGTWTSNQNQSGTFTAIKGALEPYSASLSVRHSRVDVGRHDSVTVAVTADSQSLTDVAVNGLTITSGSADVTSPATTSGVSIPAGSTYDFDFTVAPTLKGHVALSCTVSGSDAAGAFSVTVTGGLTSVHVVVIHHHVVVAPIASALGTPGEVFHSMPHNLANAALSMGIILFITFPSNIFNATFSAHYEEISGFVERTRRRLHLARRKETGLAPQAGTPGRSRVVVFVVVLLLGAVLGALLNPKFGLNAASATGLGSTLLAFLVGTILSWQVTTRFRRWHHYPTSTYLKALPLGLVIAGFCVLLSRATHFEPGYLYGVVVGVAFAESTSERHGAHLNAISTLVTLGVALGAWFAWVPINHLTLEHVGNIPLAVLDDVLGSIFVGGLVGSVFGLLPLALLPGRAIKDWRRDAWAVLFFAAVFLLVEVELRPDSGPSHPGGAAWTTIAILFVVFGGATFYLRWYFDRRAKVAASPVVAPAPTVLDSATAEAD